MQTRFLGVTEASRYLGQETNRFIRRLVAERRITFYKIGKFVKFDIIDLDAFAEAGKVEAMNLSTWDRR